MSVHVYQYRYFGICVQTNKGTLLCEYILIKVLWYVGTD